MTNMRYAEKLHCMHVCGFSPVWIRECFFKSLFWKKDFLHRRHSYLLSPLWYSLWAERFFFLHKCLWAFVTSIVKCHLSSEFQYFIYEVECCSKVQTLLELPVATNQAYNFPFHNLHSLATLTQGREAEEQLWKWVANNDIERGEEG